MDEFSDRIDELAQPIGFFGRGLECVFPGNGVTQSVHSHLQTVGLVWNRHRRITDIRRAAVGRGVAEEADPLNRLVDGLHLSVRQGHFRADGSPICEVLGENSAERVKPLFHARTAFEPESEIGRLSRHDLAVMVPAEQEKDRGKRPAASR